MEERNLLSVAYKNVIGSRRAAWRTLNAGVDDGKFDDLVVAYRKQVEGELSDVSTTAPNKLDAIHLDMCMNRLGSVCLVQRNLIDFSFSFSFMYTCM